MASADHSPVIVPVTGFIFVSQKLCGLHAQSLSVLKPLLIHTLTRSAGNHFWQVHFLDVPISIAWRNYFTASPTHPRFAWIHLHKCSSWWLWCHQPVQAFPGLGFVQLVAYKGHQQMPSLWTARGSEGKVRLKTQEAGLSSVVCVGH